MARTFDFGADVAKGSGASFKNPTPGSHEAIISAIVHIGQFQDVFIKGGKKDIKAPCNFVLVKSVLMGEEDKNDDGSRMEKWTALPLKSGDKATLTKFMAAVDPKEAANGFNDFIGMPYTAEFKANEKGGKNEDGTWKYVEHKGYAGIPERLAKMVMADAADVATIGHILFKDVTREILDDLPAYMVRQYLLNEANGTNLSVKGSPVEALLKAAREADPEWKAKKADDKQQDSQDDDDEPTKAAVPAEVSNVAAPALDENAEF